MSWKHFIVTKSGKIFSGDRSHADLAKENGIPEGDVHGGGYLDPGEKQVRGKSGAFGWYDPDVVRSLLPGWDVEEPL